MPPTIDLGEEVTLVPVRPIPVVGHDVSDQELEPGVAHRAGPVEVLVEVVPEGLEEEVDRLREVSSKIPGAMMKMAKYMMNSSVQEAMTRMSKDMDKLNN